MTPTNAQLNEQEEKNKAASLLAVAIAPQTQIEGISSAPPKPKTSFKKSIRFYVRWLFNTLWPLPPYPEKFTQIKCTSGGNIGLGSLPIKTWFGDERKAIIDVVGGQLALVVRVLEPGEQEQIKWSAPLDWNEKSILKKNQNQPIKVVTLPVKDHCPPNIETPEQRNELINCLLVIRQTRAEKGNIFFHCKAGKGRSTTIYLLYLILYSSFDQTIEEAMRELKIVRPQSFPNNDAKFFLKEDRAARNRRDFPEATKKAVTSDKEKLFDAFILELNPPKVIIRPANSSTNNLTFLDLIIMFLFGKKIYSAPQNSEPTATAAGTLPGTYPIPISPSSSSLAAPSPSDYMSCENGRHISFTAKPESQKETASARRNLLDSFNAAGDGASTGTSIAPPSTP
jgi:protein-tyrosine phosphatase